MVKKKEKGSFSEMKDKYVSDMTDKDSGLGDWMIFIILLSGVFVWPLFGGAILLIWWAVGFFLTYLYWKSKNK